MIKTIKKQAVYFTAVLLLIFSSCKKDNVEKEPTPEPITRAELTFTDLDSKKTVKFISNDPDGDGAMPRETETIKLLPNKKYELTIKLYNGLVDVTDAKYDVTEEIKKESDEHQFFFKWTDGLFSDPKGDGNIDNRQDPLVYDDKDETGQPIGLKTTWTTGGIASGKWRVLLKHQPKLKGASSTSNDGETDLDIEFPITITIQAITIAELTFTDPEGKTVKFISNDPDGKKGPKPRVTDSIKLAPNKKYELAIKLYNGFLNVTDAKYDVTEEVKKEADEHQFFFEWTDGLFSAPTGNGNVDNRQDPLVYNDKDEKGQPLGLKTAWTTGGAGSGTWRVLLQHQRKVKSSTSTSKDGHADIDIAFPITVR